MSEPMILDFDNAAHRKLFNGYVRGLRGLHRVAISKVHKMKTESQLGYLFGAVYPTVADAITESWGEKVNVPEVHEMLKEKFLSEPIVNPATGEVMLEKIASVATLDVVQMSEYIEQIVKFAGEYLHTEIPEAC